MKHILRIILVAIALLATSVSSFIPANARFNAFSIRTSTDGGASSSTAGVFFKTTRTENRSTNLFASPGVTDKPATKEFKQVSKSSEKESTPSNSKGWAVRLYNDPMNKREFVARCLTEVCALSDGAAYQCMMKAHQFGLAVIGEYHLEMAELYKASLTEHGLMVDMVPVDDDK